MELSAMLNLFRELHSDDAEEMVFSNETCGKVSMREHVNMRTYRATQDKCAAACRTFFAYAQKQWSATDRDTHL